MKIEKDNETWYAEYDELDFWLYVNWTHRYTQSYAYEEVTIWAETDVKNFDDLINEVPLIEKPNRTNKRFFKYLPEANEWMLN